ncbi:MAG: hypothetical protein HRT51_13930 [Colwellia sp.]|nr:hypothetical protein [Colwellia sp.]
MFRLLCSGRTVCRGAMDGKERVCSGRTVCRGAMSLQRCNLLDNAGEIVLMAKS